MNKMDDQLMNQLTGDIISVDKMSDSFGKLQKILYENPELEVVFVASDKIHSEPL